MQSRQARERMDEIRRIMERTTLYTLLPGIPSLVGGVAVLIGCIVSYTMIGSVDARAMLRQPFPLQIGFCALWTAIGLGCVAYEVIWTTRTAHRRGVDPVGRPGKFAALSLSPSLLVAVVITLRILVAEYNMLHYIAPVWMMCYGTGVYAAGLFSVRLPRLLGLAFIAMGAVGLMFFAEAALVLVALSFGLLHLAFGVAIVLTKEPEPDDG
jgi:hypothetical protein